MLIDTHTHLQFDAFDADRQGALARARAAGVARMVVIGTTVADSQAAVALAQAHPGVLSAVVGVHPNEAASLDAAALAELRRLAARPEVVAIGETGLDWFRDRCPREVQREAFRRQQELALELGLPLVIHSREALDEIDEELVRGGGYHTRVVMHCFTTHPERVQRFLDRGCWIGLGGPVTYPKAADAHEVARRVPDDRLLVETDCPYLAPQPVRGTWPCEPAHVALTAERLAELRGTSREALAAATTANAARFFGW